VGEFAFYCGKEVKIGTCEDMYYLRFNQRYLVRPLSGNVDPVKDAELLRFRFPFPDEDNVKPGEFDDSFRGIGVCVDLPLMREHVAHHTVQFRNEEYGLNVSLPCPDGPKSVEGVTIHKNGHRGTVVLKQQRLWKRRLVIVVECGSCGASFRLPEFDEARPIVEAFDARSQRDGEGADGFYRKIADRITAGYAVTDAEFQREVTA
jgi:hypothetical protein